MAAHEEVEARESRGRQEERNDGKGDSEIGKLEATRGGEDHASRARMR